MDKKEVYQKIAENVINALSHARITSDGEVGKWQDASLSRKTGIARSTMRRLRNCAKGKDTGIPDLETLLKIADVVNIPIGFLMMSANDWNLISRAVNDIHLTTQALVESKEKTIKDVGMQVEYILTILKTFAIPNKEMDSIQKNNINMQNNRKRQACHILGNIMLYGTEKQNDILVSLAAAVANQLNFDKTVEVSYHGQ